MVLHINEILGQSYFAILYYPLCMGQRGESDFRLVILRYTILPFVYGIKRRERGRGWWEGIQVFLVFCFIFSLSLSHVFQLVNYYQLIGIKLKFSSLYLDGLRLKFRWLTISSFYQVFKYVVLTISQLPVSQVLFGFRR